MQIEENYSLLHHNTFGIQATARWFVEYNTVDELGEILDSDLIRKNRYLAIGEGSNLLFCSDFDGVILHSAIRYIETIRQDDDSVSVEVGSGVNWDDFVAYCVSRGWYGAENLSFIPGEIGASAVQNIGAYGVEAKDIIETVYCMFTDSGKMVAFDRSDCHYGYRDSIFKHDLKGKCIVTSVVFRLSKKPCFNLEYGNLKSALPEGGAFTLQDVRNVIIEVRSNKLPDPRVIGSAGSFFMNPVIPRTQYEDLKVLFPDIPHYVVDGQRVKVPAGWLIDHIGWRGKNVGGASVYEKQCLVLVNKNNATAADVINLAQQIQDSVKNKYNIKIIPEVNYIE